MRGKSALPRDKLEVPLTLRPMEAEAVDVLPEGDEWHYEPKYDGFRCLAFRERGSVVLQSRHQKPLNRYFPELTAAFLKLPIDLFVLDGEIILKGQAFETLQLRLHPAASRVTQLAHEHPATFVAFDLLADADGRSMRALPFKQRREALGRLRSGRKEKSLTLSKTTRSLATAQRWLQDESLEGIVAKRLDLAYQPGRRAMRKFRRKRTIDCVVGGLYWKEGSRAVNSLLLGLYDGEQRLHYVGRIAIYRDALALGLLLEPFVGGEGFTGRAPGQKNRWSGKERQPVPLRPVLVAEVTAEHVTSNYMRHGARFLRWRTDKAPKDCLLDQLKGQDDS